MTYLEMAKQARDTVNRLLLERGLSAPERWLLVEYSGLTWLIGILPTLPKVAPYSAPDVTHSLSTALGGKPVILSNHTGLRYAVLLSDRPRLPDSAPFPGFPPPDRFGFGIGFHGLVGADAHAWQNMLIGGGQGSGKSTFLRALVFTARAHNWDLYLSDPDGHTFGSAWNAAAKIPVANDPEQLVALLAKVEAEISRRSALFQEAARSGKMPADIDAFNKVSPSPLSRALVAIDEANTFLDDRDIVRLLGQVARHGRKWGVHMVLAAHNWRAKDVSRELSAMLQTRVSFRVADDTSAIVTLDSRRWGLYALGIQTPGRAVIRLEGRYEPIQTFMLDGNMEDSLEQPVIASALNDQERDLVRIAIEALAGQFKVHRLAELLSGRVSEWKIRTIAEEWERRGWLTRPADAVSARLVTPELAKLAGLDSTGTQAS